MVISDRPLQEVVPLQLAEDKTAPPPVNADGKPAKPERQYKIVTQYSMGPVEDLGLLKMDFLGLRNLDVIEDAIDIIRRSRGEEVEMDSIPLDDRRPTRCWPAATRPASSSSSRTGCATR